jgi:ubiquinone/menaquinone biosynthesis C-methylase UbiE
MQMADPMPDKGGGVTDESQVANHYTSEGITARVLAALRKVNGPDVPMTPDTLAPIDHFHGKGAIATEEIAALLQPKASDHVLDIGCGIGGPARWIAAKYGCHVTGVDLTSEFCEAVRELNGLCGLADRVRILHGSALALPLPDDSFDHAYSQAVLVNISDKRGVLQEALRVLRPGGSLALSLAGAGSAGKPCYPLPWATMPDISFLVTPDELRRDLRTAGFQITLLRDTATAMAPVLKQLETEGLPPLGEHVVTGENTKEWRINAIRGQAEGRLSLIEALARKPS